MPLLRFLVGRYLKRLMRADAIDGVLGDDAGGAQERGVFSLRKQPGGRLGLNAPGADVLSITAEGATALSAAGEGAIVLFGWPEEIFIVRRGGSVVYAEGDVVHFGDLALDPMRTLRRTGFDYITEAAADVRVHLELEQRGQIDADRAMRRLGFQGGVHEEPIHEGPATSGLSRALFDTVILSPGVKVRFGPYELTNDRSYDHERRRIAGTTGHAYFFRLSRMGEEPVGARDPGLPDPFAVKDGNELVLCARKLGLLDGEEVVAGEPMMIDWLSLYEGPRGALEKDLRAAGPAVPQLRFAGDTLEAHAALLRRGEGGTAQVGKIVIALAPVGPPRVFRSTASSLPGRLRRPGTLR